MYYHILYWKITKYKINIKAESGQVRTSAFWFPMSFIVLCNWNFDNEWFDLFAYYLRFTIGRLLRSMQDKLVLASYWLWLLTYILIYYGNWCTSWLATILSFQPYCTCNHTVFATILYFYSPPYNIGPIYGSIWSYSNGKKKIILRHKSSSIKPKMYQNG